MDFRILKVNLNSRKVKTEKISKEIIKNWLGGRGLGAKLLYEEIVKNPKVTPFSEKNPVFVTTSPLTGYFPSANRTWITTISPLTDFYTTSSGGGFFAGELKEAGYLGIKIIGKSEKPVLLNIKDKIELKDAKDHWGTKVYDFVDKIHEKGCKVLSIGPAGENLVKYAGTFVGIRSCSRGGTGAILGSKKIKGIIVRGSGVKENKKLEDLADKKREEIVENELKPREKTLGLVGAVNSAQAFPTENWKENKFEGAEEKTGLPALKKYIKKTKSCYKCPIGCWDIMESKYTGEGDGVEYEIAWAFGANLGNDDPEIIIAANHLCDQYGLDVLNTAGAIAWAKEASKKGLLDYKWKGKKSILELIELIAKREGIGSFLGEGSRDVEEKFGGDFSIDVRGMNLPAYDPRGMWGMSLTYSQGPRYGCHLKSWTAGKELKESLEERTSTKNKARLSYKIMVNRVIKDSVSVCSFVDAYSNKDFAEIYSIILNEQISEEFLKERGHEIQKLERKIDKLRGIKKENDILPKRVLEESVEIEGKVVKIGKKNLKKMNEELYKLREI